MLNVQRKCAKCKLGSLVGFLNLVNVESKSIIHVEQLKTWQNRCPPDDREVLSGVSVDMKDLINVAPMQCERAGSCHDYHRFHAFPLRLSYVRFNITPLVFLSHRGHFSFIRRTRVTDKTLPGAAQAINNSAAL